MAWHRFPLLHGIYRLWTAANVERYSDRMDFPRITIEADKMGGQPCIRGLRIPVATVVAMVADGMTTDEILIDLPDLEPADISEALRFAAESVRERELPIREPA